MIKSFAGIKPFKGELTFTGDKSISHRALILSAMAKGESVITNLSTGDDVRSTISCLQQLGVNIRFEEKKCIVNGKGFKGFSKPETPLNAGNSGTTARLLSGLLSAQDFDSEITGDESLSERPMSRVIEPLTLMGADIKSVEGTLPLKISSVKGLKEISYELPVPSAQVKSSIILAALHCNGTSELKERIQTRNHTEILLSLHVEKNESYNLINVSQNDYPLAKEYYIPGDISSAAFFIVLTLLTEGASLLIKNILLNETRTGIISILQQMGGSIEMFNLKTSAGEVYGDIKVRSSRLKNIRITGNIIPSIIDEIPALTIAGIFAEGKFEIRQASELKVKETNRLRALHDNLNFTNLSIREYDDGFTLEGSPGDNMPVFDSFSDHRMAMSFIILSCLLKSGGSVLDPECISISNPEFLEQLHSLQ